jgi:membrane protease subunit HflK
MPWNDNKGGGGGWNPGGGGRGPWGQGPNGGGRGQGPNIRPPDLEELFKRAREWLNQMFPKQSPFGVVFAFIGGAFLVLWLLTGVYIIQQPEQGVVLRFGKFVDILEPGLHLRFPQPIETVIRQNVQQARQVNVGFSKDPDNDAAAPTNVPHESLMLTGDENIVDIDFTVFWKVRDAADFSFRVKDPEDTIKAIAESAMREAVGQEKIGIAQTGGRGDLEDKVRTIMQAALDGYRAGVTITKVNVQKVDPPSEVIDSFRDVQAALQDKVRKQNDAAKYANSVVPRARGEASKIVQDAEAYKQQQIAEAKGEAQRFVSIYDQYRNSKEVTRERMFLETMQRVLGSTNKIIMQSGANAPPVMYMPLPELRRSQAPTPPPAAPAGANP